MLWPRLLKLPNLKKRPNLKPEWCAAVGFAEGKGVIYAILIYAVSVLENLPIPDRFRV